MWRTVLTTMLALCLGCGARFPAAPRDGGPPWFELTSEHFTVWTDGDPARVSELIRQFERFHHVASVVAYPTAPSSGRALAIVVRNDGELSEVNNGGEARAFAHTAEWPLWQPVVVLSLTASEQRTVVHELVHLVSYAVIHHQPRWLSEGMATYFESMQLDPSQSTVTVGAAPRYRSRERMVPVSQLFDWNQLNLNAQEIPLYQTAWALFAFLNNEHRTELAHYLWLIDRTGAPAKDTWREQQRHTWNEGFPSLPFRERPVDRIWHGLDRRRVVWQARRRSDRGGLRSRASCSPARRQERRQIEQPDFACHARQHVTEVLERIDAGEATRAEDCVRDRSALGATVGAGK